MDKELGQKIDKDFDLYVEDFLTRGKNKGLKPSSLTPQEWQKLSESLAQKGVGLVPIEYNGREYYKFARLNTQEPVKQEVDLHAKIDKSFDNYLKEFLQTGKNRGFKQSLLTEQEWQKLNDELASSNIVMVPITYNGYNLYKFAKAKKSVKQKPAIQEKNIYDESKKWDLFNSISQKNLDKLSLEELVRIDDMVSCYENTTDLSSQREKINQEYLRRRATDTNTDLRFAVHEIKTGYKVENWAGEGLTAEQYAKYRKRSERGWVPNFGWKFHLDVVPNRNHPVTKAISDFLIDLNVLHKIAHGGENGKGMTVYVGSYDDVCKLAHIVQERFGSKIYKPSCYTNQYKSEYPFEPTVYGRFCSRGAKYPTKGFIGIGAMYDTMRNGFEQVSLLAQNLEEVEAEIDFLHYRARMRSKRACLLLGYCSHRLYTDVYGEYYHGKSLRAFENKFWPGLIPPLGTQKRKNWDKIADAFIQVVKEKGWYESLRAKSIKCYIPLDFGQLDKEQNANYQYTHDNGRQ